MAERKKDNEAPASEADGEFGEYPTDALFFEEDNYMDRLEELSKKIKCSGGMGFIEIDGFLHGIICHSDLVPPSIFLPDIFGEEDGGYPLTDETIDEAVDLILWRYDDLLALVEDKTFYPDPWICSLPGDEGEDSEDFADDDAEAVFGEDAADEEEEGAADDEAERVADDEEAGEAGSEGRVAWLIEKMAEEERDWATGFLQGLSLGGDLERLMSTESREEQALLVPFLMLATNELPCGENSPEFGKPLTPKDRDLALDLLPSCVAGIYEILHSPRKSTKVSRNDPCPCGSGKKYKKCCLNKSPCES